MNEAMIQLVILAAVAVFMVLRLKSLLGTREGFEPEPEAPQVLRPSAPEPEEDEILDHVPAGSPAAGALARMKVLEPNFSVTKFLQGARGAYEMILTAFDKGEMERIKPFLAPEVFEAFEAVVAGRAAEGRVVKSEFLGIREIEITNARFDEADQEAEITVRFVGEMISSVRNAAGEVVEGDARSPRKQRDTWVFARQMGTNNPNWQLVATQG